MCFTGKWAYLIALCNLWTAYLHPWTQSHLSKQGRGKGGKEGVGESAMEQGGGITRDRKTTRGVR